MKLFTPDHVIECEDKFDLQKRLFSMICDQCCAENGITEISDIGDMLATACGAQYEVDDHRVNPYSKTRASGEN